MYTVQHIDHVGIRVTDREKSLAFYGALGFRIDPAEDDRGYGGVGIINDAGARIHLIYNSEETHESGNILLDHSVKYPGYTHAAFVVDDMAKLVQALNRHDIKISGGPVVYGQGRRIACFFRDPDGNVVEVMELLKKDS